MGRIKSTLVKRASKQLLQREGLFAEEFDHNKRILGNKMPSKKIRNKIAGYIARIKRMQREQVETEQKKENKVPKITETPEYEAEQLA